MRRYLLWYLLSGGTGGGGGSSKKYIVPKTDFSFVNAGGGIYAYTVENTYQLKEGKTYKVLWDGKEYEFVYTLYTVTVLDGQVVPIGHALGNPYFFNIYSGGATNFEDTGDPFMIGIASDNTFAILTNETDSTHTVAVYEGSTGATSDDVRYVTFMSEDGKTELLVKPVAVGDDCADVIARGLISKPTKESTPQYNYTFTGWALSAGGTADANALKSVTEDRTVYVAFKSVLRYYTIRFYDGDSLLKSESLAYGSMPSYEPDIKAGYEFTGWLPEISMVTGAVDYYAQWVAGITFANATWEQIVEIANNGQASDYFEVGETRTLDMTYSDGTTDTFTVAIAGFAHDDLADGSGKSGMTIVTATTSSNANAKIYGGDISDDYTNKSRNWRDSTALRSKHDALLSAMPSALQSGVRNVNKPSYCKGELIQVPSTVFALSGWEIDAKKISSNFPTNQEGEQYAYFKIVDDKVNKQCPALPDGKQYNGTSGSMLLLRSEGNGGYFHSGIYTGVNTSNALTLYGAKPGKSLEHYLRFGFCLGKA